jgi:outer membrane protein TolC
LPWRIVAQDRPEDAAKRIEQLEKDNASLRQELEKIKNAANRDQRVQVKMDLLENRMQREMAMANLNVASNQLKRTQKLVNDNVETQEVLDIARAQFEKLQAEIVARDKSISEREAALAQLGGNQNTAANDLNNFGNEDLPARESARLAQRRQDEIAAAEADLDKLRARYTDNHPAVVEAQKRLLKLKEGARDQTRAIESKRKAQERVLFLEELKLAQKYAESMQKQMEVGRGTLEELVRAQRQVFAIQREIAKLDADHAQLRQVVQEEMKALQRLLNEARKRVEIGTASPGHDLDLQREMLRLKRELLQIED